jgi:chemotaxis protein MotB
MKQLEEAIEKSQALAPFKDQLLLDISPDGLRLQIVDKQNRAMFDSGKAELKDYTVKILRELAPFLTRVPNMISISGHTDAKPFGSAVGGYSNWELSTDRANAARRELVRGGYPEEKLSRVVGLASSALFVKDDPLSPINRRISIIAMTRKAAEIALATDAPPMAAPPADASKPADAPAQAATPAPLPPADVLPAATPPAAAAATPATPDGSALAAARAAVRAQAAARAAAAAQSVAPKPAAAPTALPSAPTQTPPATAPAPAAQPARPAKNPAG